MALGELLAIGAVQERQVRIAGRHLAQRLEDKQLARRVGEVVVTADHVGDAHLGVVDGDREVVEDRAVRTSDHRVVLKRVLEPDLTADRVRNDGLPLVGDPQSDRSALGLGRGPAVPRGRGSRRGTP